MFVRIFRTGTPQATGTLRNVYDVAADALYHNRRVIEVASDIKMNRYKEIYAVDTSKGNITISTPASKPKIGDYFRVMDRAGSASVFNITVDFLGKLLYGQVQNCTINTDYLCVDFVYLDLATGWIIK